jgi:CelD/BcsL family acetyltransferase involved in cellulose biosynthesis
MRADVLTAETAFQTLRPEWLRLLGEMSFQSVFFTPHWQETWWRHFGAGRQLSLLTVRSDDGRLQGLAPLMRSNDGTDATRLEFIGDLELCDYSDLLIAPHRQDDVVRAIADYLVSQANEDVEICLNNLSASSPTAALLQNSLTKQGLSVETETIETCPTIVLPADWNAYLAALRGKDRHELRRKIRRAENAAELAYTVTSTPEQLDEDLDTFIALHRMSQQDDKQGFMTPSKAAFFEDMAHQLWREGWLELAFLHADDRPIAGLCCMTYGPTYAAYNSGYHPDYGALSAGIVLFADRIRSAIGRGFVAFDFLRGNEAYKYRFGAKDRPLSQFVVRSACPLQESCV